MKLVVNFQFLLVQLIKLSPTPYLTINTIENTIENTILSTNTSLSTNTGLNTNTSLNTKEDKYTSTSTSTSTSININTNANKYNNFIINILLYNKYFKTVNITKKEDIDILN